MENLIALFIGVPAVVAFLICLIEIGNLLPQLTRHKDQDKSDQG